MKEIKLLVYLTSLKILSLLKKAYCWQQNNSFDTQAFIFFQLQFIGGCAATSDKMNLNWVKGSVSFFLLFPLPYSCNIPIRFHLKLKFSFGELKIRHDYNNLYVSVLTYCKTYSFEEGSIFKVIFYSFLKVGEQIWIYRPFYISMLWNYLSFFEINFAENQTTYTSFSKYLVKHLTKMNVKHNFTLNTKPKIAI